MSKKIIIENQEIVFEENDFELRKKNEKISDQKFDTKPTTYFKDALRRFRKNKASVVAASIIFALFLGAMILPVILPNDISRNRMEEATLKPKLFNAGTGFWDGTKKYNLAYDEVNELPFPDKDGKVFRKDLIISQKISVGYTNNYYENGQGGYYFIGNEKYVSENATNEEVKSIGAFLRINKKVTFTADDNFTLKYNLSDEDYAYGKTLGEYNVYLEYTNNGSDGLLLLKDWSADYGANTINISEVLASNSIDECLGQLFFMVKPTEEELTYIMLESLSLNCDNQTTQKTLDLMSMNDANKKMGITKTSDAGYWAVKGDKQVFHVTINKISFVYDDYAHVYGTQAQIIFSDRMKEYINKGWCEYDFNVGPSSFKILNSKKCPIRSVQSQETKYYPDGSNYYQLNTQTTMYLFYGYSSMPRFLFGTNAIGHDIVKICFTGLRKSFILAISVSAICLTFGLVWGAVSGYFGGNIDLAMERFCDILAGVPFLVMMTLALLHFGRTPLIFAMTLCLTGWMGIAARTRTQFYRYKGREYVLASRTLGANDARLIFRHILPNALGTIVTSSILMIPSVIFSEATLAYLGLGFTSGYSFGNVLNDHQVYINSYPALIVFPAVIISLIMISFNLFGNGLRDALNPTLKGSE